MRVAFTSQLVSIGRPETSAIAIDAAGVPFFYSGRYSYQWRWNAAGDGVLNYTLVKEKFGNPIHGVWGFNLPLVVPPWAAGEDVGANPTVADLNGDGIPELILGIRGFRNDTLLAANADRRACAEDKVLRGEDAYDCPGSLHYFTLSAKSGAFERQRGGANPFEGVRADDMNRSDIAVSANAVVSVGDVTGDGLKDAVVGGGGPDATELRFLEYTGNKAWVQYEERLGASNPFTDAALPRSPAPALGDVDGDGFVDCIVGGADGSLWMLRNDGSGRFEAKVELRLDVDPRPSASGAPTAFARTYAVPTLFDLTGNGQLDLIVTFNEGPPLYFSHPLCVKAPPCSSVAAGYCPIGDATASAAGWGVCACNDGYNGTRCGTCDDGYGRASTVENVGLVCRACRPGERSERGSPCVACPAGLFSTAMATACAHCVPGSLTRAAGAGACEVCGAGRYVDEPGATRCTQCPRRGVRCSNGELTLLKGWWYSTRSASAGAAGSNASAAPDPGIDAAAVRVDESTEMRECALSGRACEYGARRRVATCAPTYTGAFSSTSFFVFFERSSVFERKTDSPVFLRKTRGPLPDLLACARDTVAPRRCALSRADARPRLASPPHPSPSPRPSHILQRSAVRRLRGRQRAPRRRVRTVRRRNL
jgi:hypothetical protein